MNSFLFENLGNQDSLFKAPWSQQFGYFIPEDVFSQFWLCELKSKPIAMPAWPQFPKQSVSKTLKTIETYDFSQNIQRLLQQVEQMVGSNTVVTKTCKKSQACTTKKISKRRWRFTGVTKNSSNYQTLIVVNGRKIYVGSYVKEEYAAVWFDFYALLLHGTKATTNFPYTAEEIYKMVELYAANNNSFDPQLYVTSTNTIIL